MFAQIQENPRRSGGSQGSVIPSARARATLHAFQRAQTSKLSGVRTSLSLKKRGGRRPKSRLSLRLKYNNTTKPLTEARGSEAARCAKPGCSESRRPPGQGTLVWFRCDHHACQTKRDGTDKSKSLSCFEMKVPAQCSIQSRLKGFPPVIKRLMSKPSSDALLQASSIILRFRGGTIRRLYEVLRPVPSFSKTKSQARMSL